MKVTVFLLAQRLIISALVMLTAPTACFSQQAEQAHDAGKIKFRLDDIRADGLRGPADGLVAVSYEFCVPADAASIAEVKRLDPSVQISPGARGRVGCKVDQALCIGNTHQKGWRGVLEKLAALAYVKEIRECFFD